MVSFYFDKMADRGRGNISNFKGMGRARVLLQAIEDFRRRRERGQGPPSPTTMAKRGRAGAPGVIRRLFERCLGQISTWTSGGRRRARGRGFPSDIPPHPGGRGRARALPLHPSGLPSYRYGTQVKEHAN